MNKLLKLLILSIIIGTTYHNYAFADHLTNKGKENGHFHINAVFNDKKFECGQVYENIGASKSKITPTDLRFFLSNWQWIDKKGNKTPMKLIQDKQWQFADIALIDLENGESGCLNGTKAMNNTINYSIPKNINDIVGVYFELGVPFAQNHQDPTSAPAPLNQSAMFWVWQIGYKFFKLEANIISHGGEKPYSLHLGSTECQSDAKIIAPSRCNNPNRVMVNLPNFNPEKQQITLDLANLLQDVNFDDMGASQTAGHASPESVASQTAGHASPESVASSCMSFGGNPACMPIMVQFGLNYGHQQATKGQQIFYAK